MKKMRLKLMIASLLTLAVTAISGVPASAQVDPTADVCKKQPDAAVCETSNTAKSGTNVLLGQNGLITRIAQTIVYIGGILSVIMIIIGGITITTSKGDPGGINSGRTTIIYAVIGLVIAIFAQAIVTFVLQKI